MTATPIHHWTMDSVTGSPITSVADEISGGTSLTCSKKTQVTGAFDYGLSGGSTSYPVDVGADTAFKAISFWLRRINLDNYGVYGSTSAGDKLLVVQSSGTGNLLYFYNGSGSDKTNLAIADTGWHHLMLVEGSDADHHWMWLDGVKSTAECVSNLGGVLRYLSRPGYAAGQENLEIDNIQWYDRVPTTTEILYLAAATDQMVTLVSGGGLIPVSTALVGIYGGLIPASTALVGIYGLSLEQGLVGRHGDAAAVLVGLVGRYGDSNPILAGLVGRYGDTLQVLAALEGRYHLMHSVLAGVEGRYAIGGSVVLAALDGRYNLQERNDIVTALTGFYSLLPDATTQSVFCPVLIGGVAVKWSSVQWTISESSYLIEASISLRDGAEFGSINKNDQVTITWQGTTYTLFVASKLRSRSVSGSPGAVDYGVDYTIVARSLTAGLDEPYALPTTLSWPAATMASTIASQLIAPLADIISLDWRLEDWLQPGGTFFLTDETPLAGLRKLAGIVGGILQTSPGNALIIRKANPVAPRDWATTTPAWTIEDSGLFSDSESEDISSLYNVITVTNQSATDSSIRFETEEIDRYRHKVKGFRVPWVDFTLATSGGAWITIENMGIVEEQIVETVEFIDGASSTTSPVYSTVSAVWLRSQLGAITSAEDGSLTSEVTGCSLAEVTYTTKYHAWIGRSDRDEEVQFYAVELTP